RRDEHEPRRCTAGARELLVQQILRPLRLRARNGELVVRVALEARGADDHSGQYERPDDEHAPAMVESPGTEPAPIGLHLRRPLSQSRVVFLDATNLWTSGARRIREIAGLRHRPSPSCFPEWAGSRRRTEATHCKLPPNPSARERNRASGRRNGNADERSTTAR